MTSNLIPFDLKAALRGEPVMLRNGSKAYVRHHETELPVVTEETLLGYLEDVGNWAWSVDGGSSITRDESQYDIVGMYPRTRIINGFKVPAPETEELSYDTVYYLASTLTDHFYRDEIWESHLNDKLWLSRGLIFLNKEDAVANAKAMLGIDPKEVVKHD